MKYLSGFLICCSLLISGGCNVNGQGDRATPVVDNNASKAVAGEDPPPDTVESIFRKNGDEASFEQRQKLREILQWGDSCNLDSEKKDGGSAGRVWGNFVGSGEYLIQVFCDTTGAYSSNYLAYLFKTETKTSKLLSFEYFERDSKKNIVAKTTEKPPGLNFDPDKQTITLSNPYYGPAQCGWEAKYTIEEDVAVLTEMRAEWNCESGSDQEKWPKLDVKTLRKTSKKQ